MALRLLFFLLCQLAGAALGGWQAGFWGALAGAGTAAWLWFAWDLWRGGRVLAWLRQGDLASAPSMRGMWGEAADRARRIAITHRGVDGVGVDAGEHTVERVE